jgi:hypothetical protein
MGPFFCVWMAQRPDADEPRLVVHLLLHSVRIYLVDGELHVDNVFFSVDGDILRMQGGRGADGAWMRAQMERRRGRGGNVDRAWMGVRMVVAKW